MFQIFLLPFTPLFAFFFAVDFLNLSFHNVLAERKKEVFSSFKVVPLKVEVSNGFIRFTKQTNKQTNEVMSDEESK